MTLALHRSIRTIISFCIIILFIAWISWYINKNWSEFQSIYIVSIFNLIALYFIFVTGLFLSAIYTKHLLSSFSLNLSVTECFLLTVATTTTNYFTFFRGGAGIRAFYLKKKHNFQYTDFLSSILAYYLVQFFVNGILGIFGFILLICDGLPFDFPLCVFFLIAVISSAFLLFSNIHFRRFESSPLKEITKIINRGSIINRNKRVCYFILINSFLYGLLVSVQTKIAFSTYGVQLTWGASIFYSAGQIPISLLTLTPAALGIQEAFTIYLGNSLMYSTSEAIQAQIIIRFVSITTLALFGPWAISKITSQNQF